MTTGRETTIVWNMGFKGKPPGPVRCSRLDILKKMVATLAPGILALQEAPPDVCDADVLGDEYNVIVGPNGIYTAFLKERWQVVEFHWIGERRALFAKTDSVSMPQRLHVCNVHLPVLYRSDRERYELFREELVKPLNAVRNQDPCRSELIVGDFNLNPYDDVLVMPSGLYANHALSWVKSKEKLQDSNARPLFNPTWAIYGRRDPPHGSFYRGGKHNGGPWYLWDQVLMSPDLALPSKQQVTLVDRVKPLDLCTRTPLRRPKKKVGSDHLPLCVKFRSA